MPKVTADFSAGSRSPASYRHAVAFGTHSSASAGVERSAGTTAWVMLTGQACPGSICAKSVNAAARAT